MSTKDTFNWLCCTWEGLGRLKKGLSILCGALVVVTAVLTLLANLLLPLVVIRAIWNILFGLLLLFAQLEWKTVISRNFGFLNHWFMRSWFYLFVGTNVMQWGEGEQRGQDILSMCIGSACIFVGVVEMLFGFKCHESGNDVDGGDPGKGKAASGPTVGLSNAGPSGPTLNVTVTPNQAAQGAAWAAKAASNDGGGGGGGGGASDNPFFGNTHLNTK